MEAHSPAPAPDRDPAFTARLQLLLTVVGRSEQAANMTAFGLTAILCAFWLSSLGLLPLVIVALFAVKETIHWLAQRANELVAAHMFQRPYRRLFEPRWFWPIDAFEWRLQTLNLLTWLVPTWITLALAHMTMTTPWLVPLYVALDRLLAWVGFQLYTRAVEEEYGDEADDYAD